MTATQTVPGAQAVTTTEEIVEQAAGYYETLMASKASESADRKRLLSLFRQNPISNEIANGLEGLLLLVRTSSSYNGGW